MPKHGQKQLKSGAFGSRNVLKWAPKSEPWGALGLPWPGLAWPRGWPWAWPWPRPGPRPGGGSDPRPLRPARAWGVGSQGQAWPQA